MEEIKKLLENMQQEIRQSKNEMLEMKEEIKTTIINNLNEKFANLEVKQDLFETKIQQQSTAIKNFERHIRRKNLILFGVEEHEKSYHELEKTIINLINTHFNFQYNNYSIEEVRRLGKRGDTTRPIKITFSTMGLKINILKNKKLLENTPYYFKEDYPLEILNKRKELQDQLKKEKQLGNKAYLSYDKLVVIKEKEQPQPFPHSHKNKRNLSESPEFINTRKQDQKQYHKKSKISNMKDFVIQKPKLNYIPAVNSHDQPDNNTQNNNNKE